MYWILFFINIAILMVCTVYLRHQLLSRYELMISLGHKPLEGDLHWTKRSTAMCARRADSRRNRVFAHRAVYLTRSRHASVCLRARSYPGFCIFAGVGAGLLGIGGGMVLGPLLVALGCLPQPIAATSA